jgi:pyrroloquinoline-quinone synthase
MTTQEFVTELDARIAKYDLLCHPFYKAWAAGELSREDLREYGREYYHHVDAFPSYLSEFAGRTESISLRRAVLANRDEEIGADGAPSHAELWLDFIEGMGGERDGAGKPVLPEIGQLVSSFHQVSREGAPEEALAAFYAYESQVPRVAAEKARGLREMYGADEKTCGYFTLHTTADVYHSRVWKNQLARLVQNDSAAARALNAGEKAAQGLWNALDGIEAARLARVA